MEKQVLITASPRIAAQLFLLNSVHLPIEANYQDGKSLLTNIPKVNIESLLAIIDSNTYPRVAEVSKVPQFGKIESIAMVPHVLVNEGFSSMSMSQLGYYLKKDPSSKQSANQKYGENHGKCASLIDLAVYQDGKFSTSILSAPFCDLEQNDQEIVINYLFFKIPIIQMLLHKAKNGKYNAFLSMKDMSPSTMIRRSQSIKTLLSSMKSLDNSLLNMRIDNLIWEMEK